MLSLKINEGLIGSGVVRLLRSINCARSAQNFFYYVKNPKYYVNFQARGTI